MHSRTSGVSDYLAQDEHEAIRIGREIVAHLNWEKHAMAKPRFIEEPQYSSEELLGIVSADLKIPYDAREIIARYASRL